MANQTTCELTESPRCVLFATKFDYAGDRINSPVEFNNDYLVGSSAPTRIILALQMADPGNNIFVLLNGQRFIFATFADVTRSGGCLWPHGHNHCDKRQLT